MTPRRAVLFDIGGPIDAETVHERRIDDAIRRAVAEAGVVVDDERYAAACRRAVASYAANAYHAIVWTLLDDDAAGAEAAWQRVLAIAGKRQPLELRAGIAGLLCRLHRRGIRLGLAANQPGEVLPMLEAVGILRFFTARDVSGAVGLRKPDPRLFLHACAQLGVAAAECIMVGDRIDNDIAPARALGVATIRFRVGRHAAQEPRSWLEIPDAEVTDVEGLGAALGAMLQIE